MGPSDCSCLLQADATILGCALDPLGGVEAQAGWEREGAVDLLPGEMGWALRMALASCLHLRCRWLGRGRSVEDRIWVLGGEGQVQIPS